MFIATHKGVKNKKKNNNSNVNILKATIAPKTSDSCFDVFFFLLCLLFFFTYLFFFPFSSSDLLCSFFLNYYPAPPDQELTTTQVQILKEAMTKIRDTVQRLATDHRESHSTVSKVGKAIDRNFIADFASTSREDVFNGPEKSHLLNQVICQHFYRQGMLDIADELAAVRTNNPSKKKKRKEKDSSCF